MATSGIQSTATLGRDTQQVTVTIPTQRDEAFDDSVAAEVPSCSLCGATDTPLEPDRDHGNQLACIFDPIDSTVWNACMKKIRPHCPQWCSVNHVGRHFEAVREGAWYHYSDPIEVVFTETSPDSQKTETVTLDVTTVEHVGGETEPAVIFMDNTIMLPSQAEAFASALKAIAQIAKIPGKTRSGRLDGYLDALPPSKDPPPDRSYSRCYPATDECRVLAAAGSLFMARIKRNSGQCAIRIPRGVR